MMRDLFDLPPAGYPNHPGFKERTTSRDAARAIEPVVATLRDKVLTVYQDAWPSGLTPDEAAARLEKSILSVRPRISELRKMGLLVPTTVRRKNDSGLAATVIVSTRSDDAQ